MTFHSRGLIPQILPFNNTEDQVIVMAVQVVFFFSVSPFGSAVQSCGLGDRWTRPQTLTAEPRWRWCTELLASSSSFPLQRQNQDWSQNSPVVGQGSLCSTCRFLDAVEDRAFTPMIGHRHSNYRVPTYHPHRAISSLCGAWTCSQIFKFSQHHTDFHSFTKGKISQVCVIYALWAPACSFHLCWES